MEEKVKGMHQVTLMTTEDNTGTSYVSSPPITCTITLQQQISDIIQQEKEDDMSPQTLPLQEETEARSGYIVSLNQLPDCLFFSVLRAGDWLVSLAEQLMDNQTSNLAEFYMGLRSYFDGGKVYNCVQSGSFSGRCLARSQALVCGRRRGSLVHTVRACTKFPW